MEIRNKKLNKKRLDLDWLLSGESLENKLRCLECVKLYLGNFEMRRILFLVSLEVKS